MPASQPTKPSKSNPNSGFQAESSPGSALFLPPQTLTPNQTINLNAFKENILISHLLKNLFVEYTNTKLHNDCDSWILYALQKQDTDSTSYVSALALAAAFFGRVQKDMAVLEQGTRNYGRALRQLKTDLGYPERAATYFTVSSALLLSIYELVVFSNISGWLEHFNGIGILVGDYGNELS
ncbi:hypothetical protein B7463_g772, partial [Scytalidium lignicola]